MNKVLGSLVVAGLISLGNANFALADSTTADSVKGLMESFREYRNNLLISNIKMNAAVAKLTDKDIETVESKTTLGEADGLVLDLAFTISRELDHIVTSLGGPSLEDDREVIMEALQKEHVLDTSEDQ